MKIMNNKVRLAIFAVVVAVIGIGSYYIVANDSTNQIETKASVDKVKVTMYKTPNCGCCTGYADELKRQGFDVTVIKTPNMGAIKQKYGIPQDKQSCHTSIIGDYFVEGHVPIEAVNKLLKEKSEIDGIGLPEMPIGTPGMPGPKREPYRVYQSVNGKFFEYVTI
jgi:hypothetical protein